MSQTIPATLIPGDGIGPEIVDEAVKVLKALDLRFEMEHANGRRRGLRAPTAIRCPRQR